MSDERFRQHTFYEHQPSPSEFNYGVRLPTTHASNYSCDLRDRMAGLLVHGSETLGKRFIASARSP